MRFHLLAGPTALLASNAFATTLFYSNNIGFSIPDNNSTGVRQTIVVGGANAGALTAVSLTINFSTPHTQAGDLVITLSNGVHTAIILNRPGSIFPAIFGGDSSNLTGPYAFVDTCGDIIAALAAIDSSTTLASESYQATTNISSFNTSTTNPAVLLNTVFGGDDRAATWTLKVVDADNGNTSAIGSWRLSLTTASVATPEPATFALTGLGLFGIAVADARSSPSGSL